MVIKYIQAVPAGSAMGLVTEVYSQIKLEFGSLVEPFTLHSSMPKLLAGAWMALESRNWLVKSVVTLKKP
jgi:hypothetical protein